MAVLAAQSMTRSRRAFPQEDGERLDFWQLRHSIDCAVCVPVTGTPGAAKIRASLLVV